MTILIFLLIFVVSIVFVVFVVYSSQRKQTANKNSASNAQNIVVLGGTRGLGKQIAFKTCTKAKAKVVAVGSSDESVKSARAAFARHDCSVVLSDCTDENELSNLKKEIAMKMQTVNIWIDSIDWTDPLNRPLFKTPEEIIIKSTEVLLPTARIQLMIESAKQQNENCDIWIIGCEQKSLKHSKGESYEPFFQTMHSYLVHKYSTSKLHFHLVFPGVMKTHTRLLREGAITDEKDEKALSTKTKTKHSKEETVLLTEETAWKLDANASPINEIADWMLKLIAENNGKNSIHKFNSTFFTCKAFFLSIRNRFRSQKIKVD